jgi:hypothetical protein
VYLTPVNRSAPFWQHVQLALVNVIMILPHHLIHLDIYLLFRWHMCGDSTWFGLKLLFFSLFLSFSFFFRFCAGHEKIISTLQFIFFF